MKATTLSIRFANMDKLATVEAILNGMGIQYLKQEYEVETEAEAEARIEQEAELSADCQWLEDNGDETAPKLAEAEPKAEKKATTSKKSTKAKAETGTKKGSEDFDYELYKSIAEQLDVYGKHGCYRFARPTVKGLMQHPEYLTKAGKLQAKVKRSALATLLTEAQKLGLQWYINGAAESKAQ